MAKKKISKPSSNKTLLFTALLLLVTFGLYFQITTHEFVNYDDDTLITKNRVVVDPELPLSAAFTWNIFSPHFKPLVLLSWRAEYQSFGDNPTIFHFNNLLLHALNVLLVFFLSIRLLQKIIPDHKTQNNLAAFFVALTFALHPLHVESVAWAVERKDVLYTFFFLLAWLAYLQYVEKNKYPFLLLSAFLYILVLLSKSMGITLIAVLFLTDYLYSRKNILALIKEKIPLIVVFIAGIYLYGLATYLSAFASGGVVGNATNVSAAMEAVSEDNPGIQIILMAFLKVFLLLVHVLLPFHISVIYEGKEIHAMLGGFIYLIPLVLAALIYFSWRISGRYKETFFGLAFFLITVSPAIAIGKYGGVGVFIGDRYTYAPMMGLLLMIVALCFRFASSSKKLPVILLGLISAGYLLLSIPAIAVWKNSETLWTHAIEKTKCAAPAYNGRGVYYLDIAKDSDKALEDFSHAIDCDSTHFRALYNRGLILMNNNRKKEALSDYEKAIRYHPTYVEAYVNKGNILRDRGDNDAAMADYNTAIRLNADFSKSYFNRGGLLLNMMRYDEAILDYTKAISLDGNYAKAYYNRGLAYFNLTKKVEACQDFKSSLDLGYEAAAKTIQDHCQ